MKNLLRALAPTLAALALASCASPTVSLSLGFPSQEAFLVTTTMDVLVVPVGGDTTQCATLLNAAVQGASVPASASYTDLTPCSLFGRATLPDPGGEPSAFIVLGRATNGVILGGCAIGQAYPGSPEIRVELFPTDTGDYQAAVTAAHLAPGSTADQRCAGSSP